MTKTRNLIVFTENAQAEPIHGLYFSTTCCVNTAMTIETQSAERHWGDSKVVVKCTGCKTQWLVSASMSRIGNDARSSQQRAARAKRASVA